MQLSAGGFPLLNTLWVDIGQQIVAQGGVQGSEKDAHQYVAWVVLSHIGA